MRNLSAIRTLGALALGALLGQPATASEPMDATVACSGEGVVAQVVSLGGSAWAQAPGEKRRALTCDDVVRSCETVITAPGGRVGLLSRDVYALLGADTQARLGKEDDAPSQLFLDAGRVRLIDARSDAEARLLVHTRDASLQARAVDAEIALATRPAGPYTRVCTQEGRVGVLPHGGAPLQTSAASCAETDRSSAQLLSGAEPEIEVVSPLDCGLPPVAAVRFDPTDVAAPPAGGSFPAVDVASNFERRPCDATGVCGGVPRTPPTGPPGGTPPSPPSPPPAPPFQTPVVVVPPPVAPCGAPGFPCN